MRHIIAALFAAVTLTAGAHAQTQNQLAWFDGLGATEIVGGAIYPHATISAGNPGMPKPFAAGNINFQLGSLPGIFQNVGRIAFIPQNFHAADNPPQPYCQFQFNYVSFESTYSMQTIAGGVQNIFTTRYQLLETGDWEVIVDFTYEADYGSQQQPWKLGFFCYPKN